MIHHIHYMRDGVLLHGDLEFPIPVYKLLMHPHPVKPIKSPPLTLDEVHPLEIARGMAEHARLEAERASREGCMGAIIGERDWGKEAALWMAEARRLEGE